MDLNELHPIIELINLQEERLVKKLDEIIAHQEKTNGRVGKAEDDIIEYVGRCNYIQDGKSKAIVRNRFIIGTLITIIGILIGVHYKSQQKPDKIPIEFIFQQTDTTYVIPKMYMRSHGQQEYREVHELYVDIKGDKK